MSGIAVCCQRYTVHGLDLKETPITKRLKELGALVWFWGSQQKNIAQAQWS
jgi:UDP-N-acetylmuramate-alanine ligase